MENPEKSIISYEEFNKLDMRVGTVVNASKVEKSTKLIKLEVNFGSFERVILTGMQEWYTPEDFINKQFIFLVNLEPRKMMGMESQGMILAIGLDHSLRPIFISPNEEAPNGDGVN